MRTQPAPRDEAFRLRDAGAAEGGRRFRVEIPPASPLFAGHFPGRPILPGVAHLAVAARALRRLGFGGGLAGVRALKLRRPVLPGDELDLLLGLPATDGWCRFELRHGEEAVSGAAVRTGVARVPAPAAEPAAAPAAGPEVPAVETLLPHAPPARFIRGVLAVSAEEIVCVAEIPRLHPLVQRGRAPAFLGIEAAAQAAAVLEALSRRREAPGARIGYLVGVRQARFAAPAASAGTPLRTAVRLQGGAFPLSVYDFAVGDSRREILAGSLSTFLAVPDAGEPLTRGG